MRVRDKNQVVPLRVGISNWNWEALGSRVLAVES